jgi:hypothetical protein
MNNQIPNTNNQIMIKSSITKIVKAIPINISLGHLDISNWNLFGIWDLEFGISK